MSDEPTNCKISELFSQKQIRERVCELAKAISRDYAGKIPSVLILTNGGIFFGVDLIRELSVPVKIECVRLSSYKGGTVSNGSPEIFSTLVAEDFTGKDILIIDDIIDTGRTLKRICEQIENFGARSVRCCVLLSKPACRAVTFSADYVGFEVEDRFVVGYGLDYAERFRELPYIGVVN